MYLIFTDGASSGNPGPGGWAAIIVSPQDQVQEIGGHLPQTTNNQMELTAAIEALRLLPASSIKNEVIEIHSDSSYLLLGITQWIFGWKKRNWLSQDGKPIANQELWQELFQVSQGKEISWKHVKGHSGVPGNERADEIAVAFSNRRTPSLYRGDLRTYPIDIKTIPPTPFPTLPSFKKNTQQKAYSYLSCVGNQLMRHSTWAECEKRVKGQSGARFRKALTPEEEVEIVLSWGFDPKDLKT